MEAIKEVFTRPKYLFLFIAITILTFIIKSVTLNFEAIWFTLKNSGIFSTIKLTFILVYGSLLNSTLLIMFTAILISVLTGLALSLLVLRISMIRSANKLETASSSFGTVIGLVAPACSSCTVGLLSILGITAGVSVLPFNGAEFTYLSIALLVFSIYSLRKNINTCKISKPH